MTTPGRAELALGLRRLIEASGLLPAEVARRAGLSEATLSRYLAKKIIPSPPAVAKIIEAIDMSDSPGSALVVRLAEDLRAGTASRVVVLRSGTATSQRRFAEIEAGAEHVASFTPVIVPGLLQIEPYARAVFVAGGQTGEQLTANLRDRLHSRQQLLDDPGHRFTQVMTEGALRWHVGSPELMVAQLAHIARRAREDTGGRVRIGIIPWTAAVDVFPRTNFDLYDHTRAAIIGTDFGTSFLDRPRDVAVYAEQFRRLEDLAVFDAEAAAEIDRIAHDFESLTGRA